MGSDPYVPLGLIEVSVVQCWWQGQFAPNLLTDRDLMMVRLELVPAQPLLMLSAMVVPRSAPLALVRAKYARQPQGVDDALFGTFCAHEMARHDFTWSQDRVRPAPPLTEATVLATLGAGGDLHMALSMFLRLVLQRYKGPGAARYRHVVAIRVRWRERYFYIHPL